LFQCRGIAWDRLSLWRRIAGDRLRLFCGIARDRLFLCLACGRGGEHN